MVEQQLEQYLCIPFLFFVLLVRLNQQVYCRNSFQLPNFLPDSKQPFCNTVPFQEEKEGRKLSRPVNSPGATRSLPVLTDFTWKNLDNQIFLPVLLTTCFKTIFLFIWELFHLLSKAFYFFTYENIHITESTTKLCRFEKTESNIFHTLAVTIYSTIITLRLTCGYGTTTIQEKTDNKVTETSASPKKYSMTDYFKCRYYFTHFRMGLLGAAHVWEIYFIK